MKSLWLRVAALAATLAACAVPRAPGELLDGARCDDCVDVAPDAPSDAPPRDAPEADAAQADVAPDAAAADDATGLDVVAADTAPLDAPLDAPDEVACLSGDLTFCAGVGCVNAQTNAEHCGRCGAACPAGQGCVAGACVARCPAVQCGAACVDLERDPTNCGACGARCPSAPFATSACAAGRCALACAAGRADCNGDPADGCEAAVAADPAHCGACGRACPERPNAARACADGRCASDCRPGFGDCDGDAANGCEAALAASPRHCGACGRACAASEACVDGACACAAGMTACAGGCVDARSDLSHCGGCGVRCAPGQVCAAGRCTSDCGALARCGDTCFDLRASPLHCGACGGACPARPNAAPTCAAGACGAACVEGFGDCDGNPANGCEADLAASPLHCGACGRACAAGPNAAPSCVARACRVVCAAGFADCDGSPTNGCEVDLRAAASCGACGNACPARANADATCAAGACGVACRAGYGDCDGLNGNGCEVDLLGAAANCGRCGAACPAGRVCSAGACACPAGATACGASCVDLATDRAHCGVCGNACAAGELCAAGACRSFCGLTVCGGACVDAAMNPSHCGACGSACPVRPNADPTCAGGRCGIRCLDGFGDCNGNPADGCEVDLRASASHCGACAAACATAPHTEPTCAAGVCSSPCVAGYGDCNGIPADGCEVALATSAASCGRCGVTCPARPNADAACQGGACGFTCRSGYGDCNGNPADGCEAGLQGSTAHCGACGNACAGGRQCVGGSCVCPAGTALCGAACVDRSTDRAHCGRCGVACAAGQVCLAGACVTRCDPLALCSNGCFDLATSASHCGACGNTCQARPNATPTCAASTCGIACLSGYGDCNGGATDGCEEPLTTSPSHCGACGNACPARPNASALCSGGACGFVCNTGFADCNAAAADGCEVATTTVSHCGACGNACPARPNADPTCVSGACGVVCRPDYGDCDALAGNGCEAALLTSASHCGGCGRRCATGQACVAGSCAAVAAPRPVAPLTTTTVLSARPLLRWELPAGVTGAWVRVCTSRTCGVLAAPEFLVTGTSAPSPVTLPIGRYFWQVQGVQSGVRGASWSPVWSFAVESVNAGPANRGAARSYVDVRGFGTADLLVGAPSASSAGRAYLYAGSPSGLASSAESTLGVATAGAEFGYSVASAGDVNGDGYGDVIVGAPGASSGAGVAYVYHGGAGGLSSTPAATLTGAAGARFGHSVASAGDVNGDGYGDVIVGAPTADVVSGGDEGKALIYRGGPAGVSTAAYRVLNGVAANDRFGAAVAGAGDVNGDGLADVVVGADEATPGAALHAGAAYVFLGRSDASGGPSTTPAVTLAGGSAGDDFGVSVASAGDVDGDGYADVIVGADDADVTAADNAGKAYVYRGGPSSFAATPYRTLNGIGLNSHFGGSVAGAGDLDGNGYGEVVVGGVGGTTTGTVLVYASGASGLSATPHRILMGASSNEDFGASVVGVGYFGSSGYPAIAVGDRAADPAAGVNAGSVTVFFGGTSGLITTPYRTLLGATAADAFGASVARGPDAPRRGGRPWPRGIARLVRVRVEGRAS